MLTLHNQISSHFSVFFFKSVLLSVPNWVKFTYHKDDLFDLLASDKQEELRGRTKSRLL